MIKEWKEFRVYLPDLRSQIQEIAGECFNGFSADHALTLWFTEEPSGSDITSIDSHWDALTELGETAKWTLYDNRLAAVEDARIGLLTASFNDLIPAERKLLLGLPLSDDDKDAILVKFPQV